MNRSGRVDMGWLIAGLVVLFVGVWFFARDTLGWNIGDLDWDAMWPILVIAVGLLIIARVLRGDERRAHARGRS